MRFLYESIEVIKLKLTIATGQSRTTKTWKNTEIAWAELCDRLKTTTRTAETQGQYFNMSKGEQDNIKDVGGFVGGSLRQGRRKADSIDKRYLITLDADFAEPGFSDALAFQLECAYCVYSTHKHTPEKPRFRLLIPLSRPVSPDEYEAAARMTAKEIGIDQFDDTTYQAHRLMYWPSTSLDGEYIFDCEDGDPLDVDQILSQYQNWKDVTQWPASSRTVKLRERLLKRQEDPTGKRGTIGAFCRTYSVEDAIEKFLPETYVRCASPDRYTYTGGSTAAGLVIYDGGKFAYSNHATDPASGKLCNAFDLVRIHKFGHMDDTAKPDVSAGKLPSYIEMCNFATQDHDVKISMAEERKREAETDFADTDWESKLDRDSKTGIVKNTLQNLTLILKYDPNLKALVFNEQLDGMEIKGEVPWKHPSKYWRDADDAQLISYVDSHYGSFSARNFDIAVAKITDDRSYHPIREYLDALPVWDGIPRVDTLLIDYLGAEDNPYVRAVTRKTLCAAICRVLNPGCKFDTMLVLNGPQGIGKSTLIAILAVEWFSDSMNLGDTRDKTAAEKLQGYWILEIGELAGLKKAEVETLRSFLSRQNDIYRASFGKRATPHPRQCIFIGTTNAESGYLRDTTGNRRFWPVKTPGGGKKRSWALTDGDVRQIWAEVLYYVKQGEKLYLDAALEKLAKEEQREALESDEREGLVRDFLDMLLPENWNTMDTFARRNYIYGEYGGAKQTGNMRRLQVSNMEIWCECFGYDRANLRRRESNEIAAMLGKLGWERMPKKERIPNYGPQYVFAPKDRSW